MERHPAETIRLYAEMARGYFAREPRVGDGIYPSPTRIEISRGERGEILALIENAVEEFEKLPRQDQAHSERAYELANAIRAAARVVGGHRLVPSGFPLRWRVWEPAALRGYGQIAGYFRSRKAAEEAASATATLTLVVVKPSQATISGQAAYEMVGEGSP